MDITMTMLIVAGVIFLWAVIIYNKLVARRVGESWSGGGEAAERVAKSC